MRCTTSQAIVYDSPFMGRPEGLWAMGNGHLTRCPLFLFSQFLFFINVPCFLVDSSVYLQIISHFTCVCAFFVVPSNICLGLPISRPFVRNQFPRSYVRSMQPILQFARKYLAKIGLHLVIRYPILRFQASLSEYRIPYEID